MAVSKPNYLTPRGLNKIQEEFDFLCTVKRPEIAEYLNETQSGGDHVDNTEYHYAYYAKVLLEARITELRHLLANAQLIEKSKTAGVVQLGSTVVIQNDDQQLETYIIVGALEANPSEGLISDECPMGQALLNHKAGDRVTVNAPDGTGHYRLLAVS